MNTDNRIAEIKKRLKQGKYYVPYAPDDIEYLLSELSKTRLERNQLEANKNYYKEQLAKAEAEGRLMELPCKVGELMEKYRELTESEGADEAETYTTGYRNGHRNGQTELLAYLLQIGTGCREAAEKALEGSE